MKMRSMDCDILVSGHTHSAEITKIEGGWYVNPGSVTGAYSPITEGEGAVPTFALLAVQGGKVVCYMYKYNEDKDAVEVSKTEFSKEGAGED